MLLKSIAGGWGWVWNMCGFAGFENEAESVVHG
jgi:hypothetical protein